MCRGRWQEITGPDCGQTVQPKESGRGAGDGLVGHVALVQQERRVVQQPRPGVAVEEQVERLQRVKPIEADEQRFARRYDLSHFLQERTVFAAACRS